MKRFLPLIREVRAFVSPCKANGACREFQADERIDWPAAGPRDIVLLPDLALELGHPEEASLCFLMWTDDPRQIRADTITLIGPDIGEAVAGRLPFGKVVLVAMEDVADSELYERYRRMDLARFDLSLKGYMLRAASQYQREWSRVSREAVRNGFSLKILGAALIGELKTIPEVKAVEVIFVTRSNEAVNALKETGVTAGRIIQAMHKMTYESEPECRTCDYQDVCGGAAQMAALRKTLARRKRERSKSGG